MRIKEHEYWANTVGTHSVNARYYAIPKSLDDIVEIVKRAEREGKRLKAIGSGHSFSDVAIPDHYLVDISKLRKVLDIERYPLRAGVERKVHANVEAGMTIQRFNKRMDKKYELSVVNMGGIDNQTLAGAISTGTHGTGRYLPAFPGMVKSMLLVTSGGKKVRIEPSNGITDKSKYNERGVDLVQNDDDFYSAVLGLGCFGVIYSFILELEPIYWLEENKHHYRWSDIKPKLEDRSIFQDTDGFSEYRGLMVQVNPYKNHSAVVVTHSLIDQPRDGRTIDEGTRNWISSIFGSIPGAYQVVKAKARKSPHEFPNLIENSLKLLSGLYVNKSYKVLHQGMEYIKHRAYDCEFAFSMENGNNDFIIALEEMFDKAEENTKLGKYQTSPMGIRFVEKSPFYISPEYNREVAYIDAPCIKDTPRIDEILDDYQKIMLRNNGIPHWGKINTILSGKPEVLKKVYPKLNVWETKFQEYNPKGTFSNAMVDRLNLGRITL